MRFRLSPKARADLDAISQHIGADNPSASSRWLIAMRNHFRRIGAMPRMGVTRPEVQPGLRLHPAGNYLILYREIPGGAEIIRVLHGARQWQALL